MCRFEKQIETSLISVYPKINSIIAMQTKFSIWHWIETANVPSSNRWTCTIFLGLDWMPIDNGDGLNRHRWYFGKTMLLMRSDIRHNSGGCCFWFWPRSQAVMLSCRVAYDSTIRVYQFDFDRFLRTFCMQALSLGCGWGLRNGRSQMRCKLRAQQLHATKATSILSSLLEAYARQRYNWPNHKPFFIYSFIRCCIADRITTP